MLLNLNGRRARPGRPPRPPKIKIILIEPAARRLRMMTVRMAPEVVQNLTGKPSLAMGKLGDLKGVELYLGGDKNPQIAIFAENVLEREYVVLDIFDKPGPVLHGRGILFGFIPSMKKACSCPVDLAWAQAHVVWKDEEKTDGDAPEHIA